MSDFVALFLLFKLDAEWYWWIIFLIWGLVASTKYEMMWGRIKTFLDREDDKIQKENDKKKIILK